jgi:hypothetical protein
MITTSVKRVTCTAHCSLCSTHFHSVQAFDRHRVGSFSDPEDPRRCEHPLDLLDKEGRMRLEAVTEDGECRMYPSEIKREVTIWAVPHSDAERERLAQLTGKRQRASDGSGKGK